MDIRDAEVVVAVADHGSVTKAARALYVAQPSLSQAIRNLEKDLGVELFDRSGRDFQVTDAGRLVVDGARRILDDVRHAKDAVRAVAESRAGTLRISVLNSLAAEPLPWIAGRFHREFPGVVLYVMAADTPDAVGRAVRTGECDVGLSELPMDTRGLESRIFGDQEMVLAIPPETAADLPDPVPTALLGSIPMIVEIGAVPRVPLPNIAIECAHRQSIWELVLQGAGSAFLPRSVAEQLSPGVVVRSLTPRLIRTIAVVKRERPDPPAVAALLGLLDAFPNATAM